MLEAVAVAVQFEDVDVVGEPVQQRAGEAFRSEDRSPLVERQVGGDQDGAPLVALAEDLEEQFCPGGGQWDEPQLIDDQQAGVKQFPLQVEQPPLVPGSQRSALPRFHRRDAPSEVPQQVHFAAMALLDRRACRMVEDAGGPGWKQPCFQPPAVNSPLS